jgi:hypothetical protein
MTPSLRGQGEGTLGVGGETVALPRPEHQAVSSNRCRRVPNRVHRSLTRAHDSIFVVCRTWKDAPKRLPAEEAARHRKRSWGQTIALRSARLPKSGVRRLGSKTNGKPAGRAFASHEEDVVDSRSGTRACPRPADPGRPLEGLTVRGGLRTGSRVGARDTKPRNGKACQRCPRRRRLSSNEEQTARPLRGSDRFSSQAATLARAPKLPE